MGGDQVLFTLRKSRKVFFIEYFCGFLLLLFLGGMYLKRIFLANYIQYCLLLLVLFIIIYTEISRLVTQYKITSTKIIIIRGIVQQSTKNVYFRPLGFATDLNIHQNRLQRLLNYGTIYLRGSDKENAFEFESIDQPQEILDVLEQLIEQNRGDHRKQN